MEYNHPKRVRMNCTPIVRHSLTIGGAVFLWLNLQLMKSTNRSTLFEWK